MTSTRVVGIALIAFGIALIALRNRQTKGWAEATIRFQNRLFRALRLTTRYGDRELRHNLMSALVVGGFSVALGLYMVIVG
jgi:heme A synthase